MALKNLTDEEMAGISGAWIDPKRSRGVFERHALLASLLPAVESAHAGLGAAPSSGTSTQSATALAGVKKREIEVDRLHDRKARGIQFIVLGLIEASDDDAETAALRTLLVRLNLETLEVIQQTYLGESGNAQRLHDALHAEPALRESLKALTLPHKRTMLDLVRQWIAAGQELGTLEHEKAVLEGEMARPSGVPSNASAALTARNVWIRTANAVTANAALVADLPAQDYESLFTALNRVAKTADARGVPAAPVEDPVKPPANPPVTG